MSQTTTTPNYGLIKPNVNADADLWGGHINTDMDMLDTALKTVENKAGVASWNTRTGAVSLTSADVTTALTYTPYNATNPAGYVTSAQVTTALGPYALTSSVPVASSTLPLIEGTAAIGASTTYARSDHVHPAAAGGASISVGDTPPASPSPGALWWDSVGGQLYLYYQDPNTTAWVPASNMQGLANAATKADVATSLNNVGRNVVHNALFNVAQRGAGPFSATGYTVDRWLLAITSDTSTVLQSVATDVDRTGIGDEAVGHLYSLNVLGTAAAGAFTVILQPIENVRRLAGKTVTVSFWAVCNTAGQRIGVSFDQNFGSGGSASAIISLNGQSVLTTTAWARYSVTVALPSANGKTLGTNSNDSTVLYLWFSSGATNAVRSGNVGVQSCAINLWGVQLEIGTVATPLEKPDPRYDLSNCQRFYQTGSFYMQQNQIGGGSSVQDMSLPVTMRAAPTIAVSGPVNVNTTSSSVVAPSLSQIRLTAQATAAGVFAWGGLYTASADL